MEVAYYLLQQQRRQRPGRFRERPVKIQVLHGTIHVANPATPTVPMHRGQTKLTDKTRELVF